jgi:hypothetical protein
MVVLSHDLNHVVSILIQFNLFISRDAFPRIIWHQDPCFKVKTPKISVQQKNYFYALLSKFVNSLVLVFMVMGLTDILHAVQSFTNHL